MDYRIEKRPAFQVAEKIKMVPIAEQKRQNMIPDFWTQSQKDGTLRHLCDISGGTLLGICYGNPPQDAEEFAYAIGAVHDKGQAIPDDLQISEFPHIPGQNFVAKGQCRRPFNSFGTAFIQSFSLRRNMNPSAILIWRYILMEIWIRRTMKVKFGSRLEKNRGTDPLARKRLLK